MNNNLKNNSFIMLMKTCLLGLIAFLPLTGGDCAKVLEGVNGNVPAEMVGNWKLIEQTGALIDICADETINFQSTGIAILKCPNSESISRDFRVENNTLTYTQTSVAYTIETLTNDSLSLLGQNVSRNLRYLKIIADDVERDHEYNKEATSNSSEVKK